MRACRLVALLCLLTAIGAIGIASPAGAEKRVPPGADDASVASGKDPAEFRSRRRWRAILVEAGGLWWEELQTHCHLYQFRRGRVVRTRYFRNPFTGQCRLSEPFVQFGLGGVFRITKRKRLRMLFDGGLTVDTVRLRRYRRRGDRITVSRGRSRYHWYGCASRYNPFYCIR